MGFMYVLASLMVLGICSADEIVKVDSKTYAHVMVNGRTNISKQMEIEKDENAIKFAPMHVMDNVTDVNKMNFTLVPSAVITGDDAASNRVVGTMDDVLGGMLTLHVDVYTAVGNVTMGNENTEVMEGYVGITLLLTDYTWNVNSDMLHIKFMIEGAKTPETAEGNAYDLGGDGMVILPKAARQGADSVANTPTVSSNMVTVSFNKTEDVAIKTFGYQFFIKPATTKVDTNSSHRVTSLGALALVLAGLVATLL